LLFDVRQFTAVGLLVLLKLFTQLFVLTSHYIHLVLHRLYLPALFAQKVGKELVLVVLMVLVMLLTLHLRDYWSFKGALRWSDVAGFVCDLLQSYH
jgi:hypothetical protein